MQDKRRRKGAGTLHRIVDEAISEMLAALPPGERIAAHRLLLSQVARVLTEAPIGAEEGDTVTALALRARLAAAFNPNLDQA